MPGPPCGQGRVRSDAPRKFSNNPAGKAQPVLPVDNAAQRNYDDSGRCSMKPVMKCERCGEDFKQTRPSKRFCGSSCKYLAWADKHPRTYVKYYGSGHPKTYC